MLLILKGCSVTWLQQNLHNYLWLHTLINIWAWTGLFQKFKGKKLYLIFAMSLGTHFLYCVITILIQAKLILCYKSGCKSEKYAQISRKLCSQKKPHMSEVKIFSYEDITDFISTLSCLERLKHVLWFGVGFLFLINTAQIKIHPVHCFVDRFAECCNWVTSTRTHCCAFPAPFQRQRSWQGQDGWPAEVKEQPDSDEADRDTNDWPACLLCVYSLFCCVGLRVNYHNIKTINKSLHPLCCLSANYADCLFLCN